MTLGPGDEFAGYTIVRQLGSGGMGEVYLSKHPRLPRLEALKILRPDISTDDTFRQRFIREADSIAGLEHPNIVTVHDRGDTDGKLWIATQYVDGIDAAKHLATYPAGVPADEVSQLTTAIAQALDHAHDRGLLHRDVKPANILLAKPDRDGERRIYLADFGIARPLDDPAGLTATNFTMGTVAYAAPEQLMGKATNGRADQYALAATAYNLLTGTALFPDSNPIAVISHHLTEPPPAPSTVDPTLAPFDAAFARALAKNPADRFARCQDFARAVAAATAAFGVGYPTAPTQAARVTAAPATQPGRKQSRSAVSALAAAILLGLLGGGVALWRPWADQSAQEPIPPTASSTATTAPAPSTTLPATTEPPPPLVVSNSPPPPPPPTPAAPTYPPAGALGEWCFDENGIGTGPNGVLYYCARLQSTDGYQWSLTPDVIPNPTVTPYTPPPPSQVDPLGPSPMEPCTVPGALVPGTLGLTECKYLNLGGGRFVWGLA
jgi:serine/threonine-protein kinase